MVTEFEMSKNPPPNFFFINNDQRCFTLSHAHSDLSSEIKKLKICVQVFPCKSIFACTSYTLQFRACANCVRVRVYAMCDVIVVYINFKLTKTRPLVVRKYIDNFVL